MLKVRQCPWARAFGLALVGVAMTVSGASEVSADAHYPDDHAPIGIMGDHVHEPGEIMLSYRFMHMAMDGNRDGTDGLGDGEVLEQGFMVTPTRMRMDMHMFGAMYGVTERLTAMVMLPWIDTGMDHVTKSGGRFTTRSNGIGDAKVSVLGQVFEDQGHGLVARAGVSVPTGSISKRDETPMGKQRLPYPMQLGSGTVDLLPGLVYTGRMNAMSWGTDLGGTIRLGENSKDYTLGDRFVGSGWVAYRWLPWLSTSFRVIGDVTGNIDGADPALNPAVVPTADPDRRGGERVALGLGANVRFSGGLFEGHRISVEVNRPVYQDLDGPQLETDWSMTAGWQKDWDLMD